MLPPTSNRAFIEHFLPLKHWVKEKPVDFLPSLAEFLQKLQINVKES